MMKKNKWMSVKSPEASVPQKVIEVERQKLKNQTQMTMPYKMPFQFHCGSFILFNPIMFIIISHPRIYVNISLCN